MSFDGPSTTATDTSGWRCVTIAEAASFLAISRSTVYVLLDSGALRSVHVGRARRVPIVELERFVRERLAATDGASSCR
ncbi:MAG: helix-turn-helix domain-containing protein [Acidimicrobiales bacterium]